jgi:hypothetical protein
VKQEVRIFNRFNLCVVLPAYPTKTTVPLEEITLIPMGAARFFEKNEKKFANHFLI